MSAVVVQTSATDAGTAHKSGHEGAPATLSGGYAALEAKAPLQAWSRQLKALGPAEVDITPTHNGLCHTDLHMIDNDYGLTWYPFVPGHEVVGTIRAVGHLVTGLRPGDRVGVGWMRDSCGHCLACMCGEDNTCETADAGSSTMFGEHGGFQAVVRVPARFVFRIPDGLDSAEAAPLLCAGVTVFAPLRRYMQRPGMSVCICGVGGVGHLGVQFANVMGGVVTALDIAADKEQEAKGLGAASFEVLDEAAPERLASRFDILLNTAAVHIPTHSLLRMLRKNGVLVQIGCPAGNTEMTFPLLELVGGQKRVVGSLVGGRVDMQLMLQVAAAKGVKPMIEVMPSDKVNKAIERLRSGQARYRVVLQMQPDKDPVLKQE